MNTKQLIFEQLDLAEKSEYAEELVELGGGIRDQKTAFKIACDLQECDFWWQNEVPIPPISEVHQYVRDWQKS